MTAVLLTPEELAEDFVSHPADVSARLLRLHTRGQWSSTRSPLLQSVVTRLHRRWKEGTS